MTKRRMLVLVLLFAMIFVTFVNKTNVAFTSSLGDISDQIDGAKGEKEEIQKRLDELNKMIQAREDLLESQTQEYMTAIKEQQSQMTALNAMLIDLENLYNAVFQLESTIKELEDSYNAKLKAFLERATIMYKYSQFDYLQLYAESEDIFDYANRAHIFANLLEADKNTLLELEVMKADLESKKSIQDGMYLDVKKAIAEKESIITAIKNDQEVIQSQLSASRSVLEKLEEQEDALLAKSKELESEILQLQKKYEELKLEYDSEKKMLWPAESGTYISSYYGMRIHPITKKYKLHSGIDIPARGGSNILAAADGTVMVATYHSSYGNYIIIYHGDGVSTLYAHSSKLIAKVGDTVKRGQVIALVGTTGSSTGNHLHFEVRIDGVTTDPLEYLVR